MNGKLKPTFQVLKAMFSHTFRLIWTVMVKFKDKCIKYLTSEENTRISKVTSENKMLPNSLMYQFPWKYNTT